MNKLRYVFKNITLLNILLAAFIVVMADYAVLPLLHTSIKYKLLPQKKILEQTKTEETEHQVPSPSDYVAVSEQNLFHPERRIPPEKKEEAPLPKPEFVLYGTLIADGTSIAYFEDMKAPRNSTGRGRRQVALKIGDNLSGFTVKEIDTDKVVMARGEEKMVIPVNDTQRAKNQAAPTTAPGSAPGSAPGVAAPGHQPPRYQPADRSRLRGSAALQRGRQENRPPQAPQAAPTGGPR